MKVVTAIFVFLQKNLFICIRILGNQVITNQVNMPTKKESVLFPTTPCSKGIDMAISRSCYK